MSRLWGPGGDKGPLAAHSPPWGQTAGITGWTAPVTGGQRWAAAQALAPPPPPQPPDHPALHLPFKGGDERGPKLGSPRPLPWMGMQTRPVKAGGCRPHVLLPPSLPHQPLWEDTLSPVALLGLVAPAVHSCRDHSPPSALIWSENTTQKAGRLVKSAAASRISRPQTWAGLTRQGVEDGEGS